MAVEHRILNIKSSSISLTGGRELLSSFVWAGKLRRFSLKKAHGLSCGCHLAPSSNRLTGPVDLASGEVQTDPCMPKLGNWNLLP